MAKGRGEGVPEVDVLLMDGRGKGRKGRGCQELMMARENLFVVDKRVVTVTIGCGMIECLCRYERE